MQMLTFEEVVSQTVVLPTGVIVLSVLLFGLFGLGLLVSAIRAVVKWRRLERDYGSGNLPAVPKTPRRAA